MRFYVAIGLSTRVKPGNEAKYLPRLPLWTCSYVPMRGVGHTQNAKLPIVIFLDHHQNSIEQSIKFTFEQE